MTAVLEAAGVTVRFGGVKACDGANLVINEQEIVGLIGPNGSGKTTLLKALVGANRIAAGEVLLHGEAVTGWSVGRLARAGVVRTAQHDMVFPSLTVEQALITAQNCHPAGSRAPGVMSSAEILELLRLTEVRHQVVATLPTGKVRKLGVAAALAVGPRVLLLDEPAAGLNDEETAEFGRMLDEVREASLTVCVVDHDMRLIMGHCDRVVVLDNGRNLAGGTPEQVASDEKVIRLYLGEPLDTSGANA